MVLRRDGRFLLARHYEGARAFYRPPGGSIEVGEYAVDAAKREIREELGIELRELRQRGVIENIFTMNGELGHEVMFIFDAEWPDGLECGEVVHAVEDDGVTFDCHWMSELQLTEPD
ncbi:MAG: NUDIX domain-containing protein, partial [Tepidiformaceae bacterium]